MHDLVRQRSGQRSDQQLFRRAVQFPHARQRQHGLRQTMIDQGNPDFQTLGHAHKIGVPQ
jgi:hypothetical protein